MATLSHWRVIVKLTFNLKKTEGIPRLFLFDVVWCTDGFVCCLNLMKFLLQVFWVIVKAIETKIWFFIINKKGRGSHGFQFIRSLTDSPWTLLDLDNESLDIPLLNGNFDSKSLPW